MKITKKLILFVVLVLVLLFTYGCFHNDPQQQEYNKCTIVCASVLGDDFVTMKLCTDECQEEFLNNQNI